MLLAPTPVSMLALGGEDDDENPALIPNLVEPIDHAPSERIPTPSATPPIIHMSLPAPVAPPAPDRRRTSCILCHPGEWWKVRRSAEPEAKPPVIWSENEDKEGEHNVK